jgi:hypothetical protein
LQYIMNSAPTKITENSNDFNQIYNLFIRQSRRQLALKGRQLSTDSRFNSALPDS